MQFTATRVAGSPTTTALNINFSVGGTAVYLVDYVVTGASTFTTTTGRLIVPIGQMSATMNIDPIPNTDVQPDRTIILTPTPVAGSWSIGTGLPWQGTIIDDDGGGYGIA